MSKWRPVVIVQEWAGGKAYYGYRWTDEINDAYTYDHAMACPDEIEVRRGRFAKRIGNAYFSRTTRLATIEWKDEAIL